MPERTSPMVSPSALNTTPKEYSCMFCQYSESLVRFITHSVYTAASADRNALRVPSA